MKKSHPIPLARPRLSPEDIEQAVAALHSGKLVSGEIVRQFESRLSDYLGVKHAICVSSGTAALHLGLLALGIGRGDEVLVPAFSFPATANAVELTGARPIFIDSLKNEFNMDFDEIESVLSEHTRAIIIVHNFGLPARMDKIMEIAEYHEIPIFEDAACALGSEFRGIKCGSLGKLAAFSFHPRKILTTGEGGAVVTNNDFLADSIYCLRNHGLKNGTKNEFISVGFNYRMTEFQAALGYSQFSRFEMTILNRQKTAEFYHNTIKISGLKSYRPSELDKANYQSFVLITNDRIRDDLIAYLKSNNIEAGIGTYSIPHTEYYSRKYGFVDSDYPHSLYAYKNLISLPLFEGLLESEQEFIVSKLREYFSDNCKILASKNAVMTAAP